MTTIIPENSPVRNSTVVDLENILQPVTHIEEDNPLETYTIDSFLDTSNLPEDQVIKGFDRHKSIIWEERTPTGRQFMTYNGKWWVEFLKGFRTEAIQWRDQKIKAKETTFKEFERKGRYLFELDGEKSKIEIARRNLNVVDERNRYDSEETVDITPYFTDVKRDIDNEVVEYLLLNPLKKLEEERQIASDMLYFSRDPSNYVDYHFGNDRTGTDIGFYRDRGGRIRASYDPQFIFRSAPLLEDLLQLGAPDEYVVGRFHTGMIQFVISVELSKRLVKQYGSEEALAIRWNNTKTKLTEDFDFGNYPTFEQVLDVTTSEFIPASQIFQFGTDAEKKFTAKI